jgi:hypothetical protein
MLLISIFQDQLPELVEASDDSEVKVNVWVTIVLPPLGLFSKG